ncbi:MAG TPA: hypothetical protein VIG30_15880 [Ktedonobacterales bacterium]
MKQQDGRGWWRSRKLGQARIGVRTVDLARAEPGSAAGSESGATARHTLRMRRRMRQHWRRLGFRRQFVGLLVMAALLSTLVTSSMGYLVLRANALDSAQAHAAQDLRVAWRLLTERGAGFTLARGELYAGTAEPLNGDTALMTDIGALTADQASVYQIQGGQLVAIASTGGAGPTGALGGSAYQALLGGCPQATIPMGCARSFAGVLTSGGVDFVVALMPLLDASGAALGALGVFTPLAAIVAPVRLLSGLLLLIGLALTGLLLLIGIRVAGPVERRAFAAFSLGLDQLGDAAVRLETVASTQVARSARQADVARHLIEEVRLLGEVAGGLEHSVAALRQTAGDIWAETSSPGASAAASSGAAIARQAAHAAHQMGAAAERANHLCFRLRARANLVIAEADMLGVCGREAREHATALRAAVQSIEQALGTHAPALPLEQAAMRAAPAPSATRRSAADYASAPVHAVTIPGASASAAEQIHISLKHPRPAGNVRPNGSTSLRSRQSNPLTRPIPPRGGLPWPHGGGGSAGAAR